MLLSKWPAFTPNFLSGYVPVSSVLSVRHGACGCCAWSALRETMGRCGFRWVSLCRRVRNYFGVINVLRQAQSQTILLVWLPGLQGTWTLSSVENPVVQPCNRNCGLAFNPTLNMLNWFFRFRGHELTQSSKYDMGPPYQESHKLREKNGENISIACDSAARACPSSFFPPRKNCIHSIFFIGLRARISESDVNDGIRLDLP